MEGRYAVATRDSIVLVERSGTWQESGRSLTGHQVTALIAREGVILAGTTTGVFRSNDGGSTWDEASGGMEPRHVRWMAYHPDISDREFAGTEPAALFISRDGAGSWRGCPEVPALRDRLGWFLPYSPEAGCVRGFAFHGNRVYAAVEVGGVLRSDDTGETWRLAGGSTGEPSFDIPPAPLIYSDVHSVVAHPSSPDYVLAATGEGLYQSEDGGDTWKAKYAGSYCRAVWVDPDDLDHIILSPADSVARKNSRIEESRDGGETWEPAWDGLDLPWPNTMVERFVQIGDDLWAITNDGRLYLTPVASLVWRRILPEITGITAIALVS